MRRWILFIVLLLILLGWLSTRSKSPLSRAALSSWIQPMGPEDEIHLSGVTGTHSAAILIDGRRVTGTQPQCGPQADCVCDETQRGSQTVAVGNVLSPPACDSRVAVLVQDRAMQFIDPVSNWTNGTGDTLNVSMGPMPTLPISIWTQTGGTGDAQVHLGSAGPIYNDMQCGIGFDGVVPIIEAAALDTLTASCNDLRPVKAVGFTPGRLNIYYVQDIRDTDDARGIHCETTDHDVILINRSIAPIPTFSHEVGHALTLVHTNDVPGLNTYTEIEPGLFECNLMLFAGTNQRPLSTGQCFRANLNSESAINRLGARTGPKPGCDRVNSSRECPQLAFDVVPK